jgi:D-3-phosphoglycerate dehydrogenase / 2-oxoglutarate reductase
VSSPARVVVVADPIDSAAIDRLRAGPCRVEDVSAESTVPLAALSAAWALVVRSRTKVTSEMIDRAPHLALIARAGVGLDNVDLQHAHARGIRVVNAPTAATTSVAELTVGLILWLIRDLLPSVVLTKKGEWKRGISGRELAGKVVGFVGYGRIAREVAQRLKPFEVSTIAYDPFVAQSGDSTAMVELDSLLSSSDVVSLHAALTPQNRHLLDASRLAKMRRGAVLVNVARGALVDEEALLGALEGGHLAGAALDVFETEPPTRAALLSHPRVIATPHLGAATPEAQRRAGGLVVDELLRELRGEPLLFEVPTEPTVRA